MRSEKSSSFGCEAAVGTDTLNVMCEVHQRAKSETSAWKNKVLHIVQDKLFWGGSYIRLYFFCVFVWQILSCLSKRVSFKAGIEIDVSPQEKFGSCVKKPSQLERTFRVLIPILLHSETHSGFYYTPNHNQNHDAGLWVIFWTLCVKPHWCLEFSYPEVAYSKQNEK